MDRLGQLRIIYSTVCHTVIYPLKCRFGAVVTRRTCNAKIACSIQAIGISQFHWIDHHFAFFGGVGLGESKLMVQPEARSL
jgi:hypothetical protein